MAEIAVADNNLASGGASQELAPKKFLVSNIYFTNFNCSFCVSQNFDFKQVKEKKIMEKL